MHIYTDGDVGVNADAHVDDLHAATDIDAHVHVDIRFDLVGDVHVDVQLAIAAVAAVGIAT